MKKTLLVMFGISVFAGAGYLAWAYTPVGRKVLSRWLMKKWTELAEAQHQYIAPDKLKQELNRLPYDDHELLALLTLVAMRLPVNPRTEKRKQSLLAAITERKILQRADLTDAVRLLEHTVTKQ